jgi:6,7-dimethyl-8-ribityllumazine synthase
MQGAGMSIDNDVLARIEATHKRAERDADLYRLTKRERIAAMAMQAFLVKGGYDKWEHVADDATNAADALLLSLSAGKGGE